MRSTYTIDLPPMPEAFHEAVKALLTKEKYKEKHYKNRETNEDEIVWQFGDGLFVLRRFIKLEYTPTQLIISGWMDPKGGLLAPKQPERSLEGGLLTYGSGAKVCIKNVIDRIIALAEQGRQSVQRQQPMQ